MKLFGIKKQESGAPADIPPELQPYYGSPQHRSWLSRAVPFVLPVLALLVLAGAVVGGVFWLQHHKLSDLLHKPASKSSNQIATSKPKKKATSAPKQTAQLPGNQSATNPAPSAPAPPLATHAANSTSQTATTAIPSTGPGNGVFMWALASTAMGSVLFHLYQIKRAKAEAD